MAEEQHHRRFWTETALIFGAWTVFGLILANQFYMQSELRGQPVSWVHVLRLGMLEATLWAFSTLIIFWLARRFPIERGRVAGSIAVHVVAAVALSLARAAFMVELSSFRTSPNPGLYPVIRTSYRLACVTGRGVPYWQLGLVPPTALERHT